MEITKEQAFVEALKAKGPGTKLPELNTYVAEKYPTIGKLSPPALSKIYTLAGMAYTPKTATVKAPTAVVETKQPILELIAHAKALVTTLGKEDAKQLIDNI